MLKNKKNNLLVKGNYILIYNELKWDRKNKVFKKNKNKREKGEYQIPGIVISYTKENLIKFKSSCNYVDLLIEGKDYLIESEIIREIDVDAYDYFVNLINDS